MDNAHRAHLQLKSRLEQLAAGLADGAQDCEREARTI